MTTPPSQVEIESKFLEVTQNNLKELGRRLVGSASLPCPLAQACTAVAAPKVFSTANINANSFPFSRWEAPLAICASGGSQGAITGVATVSGSTAIGVNASTPCSSAPLGPARARLGVAGIFTNPQFPGGSPRPQPTKRCRSWSVRQKSPRAAQRNFENYPGVRRYPSEFDLASGHPDSLFDLHSGYSDLADRRLKPSLWVSSWKLS